MIFPNELIEIPPVASGNPLPLQIVEFIQSINQIAHELI